MRPDKGLVYFYRESEFVGSARGIYISAGDTRIGALNSGTYFVYWAEPGKNVFSAENALDDNAVRTINIEPGKKYYLRGELKFGFWDVEPHLTIVHEAEGESAIDSLTYATLKEKK
jgi:hypothetical protein